MVSYCLIREIFLGKRLFFETLNACRHIEDNSTKKRRHCSSIKRLLIHINNLGTCHYQPKWFWSLLCEELLSVSLLDWDCVRHFGSEIGFVYITVYNATIATSYFVNMGQRLYYSYWCKNHKTYTTLLVVYTRNRHYYLVSSVAWCYTLE